MDSFPASTLDWTPDSQAQTHLTTQTLPNLDGLHLETTRPSPSARPLKLASLGRHIGLLVLVRAKAEVLDGLARVLGTPQKEGIRAGGLLERELVEGERLAAGRNDARTGCGGEAQSGDGDLGSLKEAVVVGNGADYDDGPLVVLRGVGGDAGEGDGRAVDARHEESAEDDLVEGAVGATGEEAIELHQELQVDIVATGENWEGKV